MENSFDHARAFLVKFFQNHPTGLDNNSAVKLMTDYAAHFITGEIVAKASDVVSDLEAGFKAKIEELEQTIENITQTHKEQLNALQSTPEPTVPIQGDDVAEINQSQMSEQSPTTVEDPKPAKKGKK